MLFSSLRFLYEFLPLLILGYAIIWLADRFLGRPARYRHGMENGLLFVSSLLFYFLGEPGLWWLLPLEGVSAYLIGWLLESLKRKNAKLCRPVFWLSCLLCTATLIYYKSGTALPLGISFFSFQILSYLVDVYSGRVKAQRSVVDFCLYITFFPQLIAGPIVRYQDMEKQLGSRAFTLEGIGRGMEKFCIGLGKKVLLANQMGELAQIFRSSEEKTVLFYWVYAIAYLFQIYFDFAGYSDMAIGLGQMFGFRLPENFNHPYASKSITEFWRRWHITLGQWFRDYVYIPLGGNRTGTAKHIRNVCVVWALTGLWHGMAANFLLWGLYFAVLLLLEKYVWKSFLEKHPVFAHGYVLLLVTVSFVIFNGAGLKGACADLAGMFGLSGLSGGGGLAFIGLTGTEDVYYLKSYFVLFLICAVCAVPGPGVLRRLWEKARAWQGMKGMVFQTVRLAGYLALLCLCTAYLVDGSYNPFLYFRF